MNLLIITVNYGNTSPTESFLTSLSKCELDSSETIFNNHKCGNSNSPPINTISNFITNKSYRNTARGTWQQNTSSHIN